VTAALAGLRYLIILAATTLAAQTVQPQADNLPGEMPLSMFQMQASKVNLLTMGLQVSTDFDDNAMNGDQGQHGNLLTLIQPNLGWRFTRTRLDWQAGYAPGFSKSTSPSAYDSVAHRLNSELQLKLTKRLRLRAHESFLRSTNPFDQLRISESAAGSFVHNTPSDSVPATPADVRTEQASLEIAYAVGPHSTAGVGGDFFSARYSPLRMAQVTNQVLQNSTSAGGHGYFSRQVTRHQWTGLEYRVQKSIFKSSNAWSLVHSVFYNHTIAISRPFTLSFFAGPERSVTGMTGASAPLAPVTSGRLSMWCWSGGVVGRWNWLQTNLTARYSRKISNDVVLGTVQLSKVSAEMRRQFRTQWAARVLASYDDNKAFAAPGSLTYSSAAGALARLLSPNLSLEFQYWRVHLSSRGPLPGALLSDYDRISISLNYDYKYPLGR
jgi:hypothetical protein